MSNSFQNEVRYLKGVGFQKAQLLGSLGILTVEDLLFHLPRFYIEKEQCCRIADMELDRAYRVLLRVKSVKPMFIRGGRKQLRVVFTDGEKDLLGVWFNYQWWHTAGLKPGVTVILDGILKEYRKTPQFIHPGIEIIDSEEPEGELPQIQAPDWSGRELLPVYPSTAGLTQNNIRKLIYRAFQDYQYSIRETIPGYIRKRNNLIGLKESIAAIHFPETKAEAETGRRRMIFEELFYHQMMLARVYRKHKQEEKGISFHVKKINTTQLKNTLPFNLTKAQKRVLREIVADMESKQRMNRLLQGDVGSGKTIIALFTMLLAIENGYQAVMLVPTEILARQHYESISRLLVRQPEINICLILGGKRKGTKESLEDVVSGKADIIIGTHALLEKRVVFKKAGLVVIDEQQRFGVQQRATLPGKSGFPDILYLSATPIPRSLALTLYGDLDISILDELPPNRKPVKTTQKPASKREEIYKKLFSLLDRGRQVYIVSPLISETEKLDLLDAERLYLSLKEGPFADYSVELIHSRMKPSDKESIMKRFQENKIDILVSTTVIEVGVDVPNASVMIIEHAERFGLSQLHQLRGRVGRGTEESFCFLVYYNQLSQAARERLKIMTETNDGFLIAEKDLELRGPGDFFGTNQSGVPLFRFTDLKRDLTILQEARREARDLVLEDYSFTREENREVRERYRVAYLTREELFSY